MKYVCDENSPKKNVWDTLERLSTLNTEHDKIVVFGQQTDGKTQSGNVLGSKCFKKTKTLCFEISKLKELIISDLCFPRPLSYF